MSFALFLCARAGIICHTSGAFTFMQTLLSTAPTSQNGRAATPQLRSAGIVGLGHYVPERVLSNSDLEKMVETSNEWIVERTGISQRRIVAPDQTLADLAENAARAALRSANLEIEQIDLIIVATCTPEWLFPSTSATLQNRLGATCGAFDLGAACSGFVYGLVTASQFVATGAMKNVLVVGAEVMSRYVNWEDRNTCVLFGDGAGAAVISAVEDGYGLLGHDVGANGAGGPLLRCGILDKSDDGKIYQNGREVYKFAVKIVGESALRALNSCGLTGDDVDIMVPHQANVKIIESAAKRLGMPMEKVFVNLQNYGNTSAASIPIALSEANAQGRLKPDSTVLLTGFGAGLTWASAVLKWGNSI